VDVDAADAEAPAAVATNVLSATPTVATAHARKERCITCITTSANFWPDTAWLARVTWITRAAVPGLEGCVAPNLE
jgi:hypothetical protein